MDDQVINGVVFRQHEGGWYPRRCSMCRHYRHEGPYIIANHGNGSIVAAWWDYINSEGEAIPRCEVWVSPAYVPVPVPDSLCMAHPQPSGWAGEPLNLTKAGIQEVPEWCQQFAFFWEATQ